MLLLLAGIPAAPTVEPPTSGGSASYAGWAFAAFAASLLLMVMTHGR